MDVIIGTILIILAIIVTICHLLFRYAPREWIFKIKEPVTIHHKRHKNGAFTFPPFHYLNLNGKMLKHTYIGSGLIALFVILFYLLLENRVI